MDPPLHFSHSSGEGAAGLSAAQFSTGRGGGPWWYYVFYFDAFWLSLELEGLGEDCSCWVKITNLLKFASF